MLNTDFSQTLLVRANPTDMLVEVTNRCNHNCIFCEHGRMTCRQGEIDPPLLNRILKEAYDMGVRRVGMYTTGEMFMCNEINTHIKNAKEIGFEYIYADTNGALATKEKLSGVLLAGLDSIKFSINAGTRETYKKIHGHDDFDKVIENLRICHSLKTELNINFKIMISFVETNLSKEEAKILEELTAPYTDIFLPHKVVNTTIRYGIDLTYLDPDKGKPLQARPSCPALFNRIHVTYDGFLTACCIDINHDLLLSDLNSTSLKDAWVCENALNLRNNYLNGQLEGTLCHGCLSRKFLPYLPLSV